MSDEKAKTPESSEGDQKLQNLAVSLSEELGGPASIGKIPEQVGAAAESEKVDPTNIPGTSVNQPIPGADSPGNVVAPKATGEANTIVLGQSNIPEASGIQASHTAAATSGGDTVQTDEAAPPKSDEISLDNLNAANPGTTTAAPPPPTPIGNVTRPAPEKKPENGDVLSIEDLDKILNEQDPNLSKNMAEIAGGLSSAKVPKNLPKFNIDSKALGIVDKDDVVSEQGTVAKIIQGVTQSTNTVVEKATDGILEGAELVKETAKKVPNLLARIFAALKEDVLTFVKWFKSRNTLQKINLLLFLVVSLGVVVVVGRFIRGVPIIAPHESPFLRSFEFVADRVEEIAPGEPIEQFDSPLRNPEYVVLFKKMFVNLKAQGASRNPMAAFEIFIEANSQEAAIELKDRERQFKDVVARVFESIPYEEVATAEGKNKLKLIIRRDLNQVINKGRVKKVYFKTFFYKS